MRCFRRTKAQEASIASDVPSTPENGESDAQLGTAGAEIDMPIAAGETAEPARAEESRNWSAWISGAAALGAWLASVAALRALNEVSNRRCERPHPAKDYTAFQDFLQELIEDLFPGFRFHKTEHFFRSTGKRADFTMIRRCDGRERLVVDAKFYQGPITIDEVRQVQGYKGHPFFAKHAAIVFPQNCTVDPAAMILADTKRVMLVELPVIKAIRYENTRKLAVVPWRIPVGYKVGCTLPAAEIVPRARWITGPYCQ
jgi:hypothetical protein